jgi:dephospho-CoA kinase
MIRTGVTGGIGSGKSRVCALFEALGVPVYYSDDRARELMNGGGRLRDDVISIFGTQAYDGPVLNRTYIATKVFSDKMLLTALNGVVHPAVALDFEAWAMSHAAAAYVVMESAILYESGFDRLVEKVVTVSAPEDVRIDRVASRDGVSRQSVIERIENQLTDEAREARADYIIRNSGNLDELAAAVTELDKKLRKL